MNLCDMHFNRGDCVKATDSITIRSTCETIDLCESCRDRVLDFIKEAKIELPEMQKQQRIDRD